MADSLFDPSNIQPGKKGEEPEALTVSELNAMVRQDLETVFARVTVRGEVSNLRVPASGHSYFTLKDENAEISAVWFRRASVKSRAKLEEGKEIVAVGRISIYEARGTYQIIITRIETKGKGDLQERLEKLTRKLREEGLFDELRKKPLPRLPRTIGVITSKTGAAVRDITNMIWTRFPGAHVVLGPVAVQGDQAAGEISAMIEKFNAWGGADVLIVGRGGGSLEDLWPFNEEIVARSISASEIPVISAVGHEIDTTISDMVADIRALTPTKAGEIVVPDAAQENQHLDMQLERVQLSIDNYLAACRTELDALRDHRIFAKPEESLRRKQRTIGELARSMHTSLRNSINLRRETLKGTADVLESLNPLAVLRRGFSYTEDEKGRALTDAAEVAAGDRIVTRLFKGRLVSEVKEKGE